MPEQKTDNQFREQPITETLEENYMPYAMSVIVSRAIPEIDGLKPSHRKLLYTMYKKGLLNGSRTKSANVVGETMKLNPHGDQAIYDTLVRMTRGNGALLHPYVDSKGNFGKQYSRDMAYAAPRYTEVKLSPICAEIFSPFRHVPNIRMSAFLRKIILSVKILASFIKFPLNNLFLCHILI